MFEPEVVTIRFEGWISRRIISFQPDMDIRKLLLNVSRIRIKISDSSVNNARSCC